MQPYFVPYPGYFRLFSAAELFVIYDCVQFPRRGWVHRNQLVAADGTLRWLTLPLKKGAWEMLIRDLEFAPDAAARIDEQLRRFPAFSGNIELKRALLSTEQQPVAYIVHLLRMICELLALRFNAITSSSLRIDPRLRGQARIIEIARRVGARHYVNPSGGRELYDPQAFAAAGLTLSFLTEYQGPPGSVLQHIFTRGADATARDVRAQTLLA